MSEYSADVNAILAGNKTVAEAARLGELLSPKFQEATERYTGCFGVTGVGDDFADQVVPSVDRQDEAIARAAAAISAVLLATVEAISAHGRAVQQPQVDASEDIHDQAGRTGDGTRH
jgi:hypothetical protein